MRREAIIIFVIGILFLCQSGISTAGDIVDIPIGPVDCVDAPGMPCKLPEYPTHSLAIRTAVDKCVQITLPDCTSRCASVEGVALSDCSNPCNQEFGMARQNFYDCVDRGLQTQPEALSEWGKLLEKYDSSCDSLVARSEEYMECPGGEDLEEFNKCVRQMINRYFEEQRCHTAALDEAIKYISEYTDYVADEMRAEEDAESEYAAEEESRPGYSASHPAAQKTSAQQSPAQPSSAQKSQSTANGERMMRPVYGRVMKIRGNAWVDREGMSTRIQYGGSIQPGDTVRTDKSSSVKFEAASESITVGPDTQLTLIEDLGIGIIKLAKGMYRAVTINVVDRKMKHHNTEVVAGVRGTDFVMGYDPDTNTSETYVYEGEVDLTILKTNQTVTLKSGDSLIVQNGNAVTNRFTHDQWNALAEEVEQHSLTDYLSLSGLSPALRIFVFGCIGAILGIFVGLALKIRKQRIAAVHKK